MINDIYPPPADVCTVPDYILGKLMYYDDHSDDNCRWVVYDGARKVRCATRKDALKYIQSTVLCNDSEAQRLVLSARVYINRALQQLDKAATMTAGNSLVLARLSARLRPFVVDLDNLTLSNYDPNKKKAHLSKTASAICT